MSNPFLDHEFVSPGPSQWNGPPELVDYCPPLGFRMKFVRVESDTPTPGFATAYYKAEALDGSLGTAATPIIEKAVYFEDGPNRLVAHNIELPGGLLMNEVVETQHDSSGNFTGLLHNLLFWNGIVATWPCGRGP